MKIHRIFSDAEKLVEKGRPMSTELKSYPPLTCVNMHGCDHFYPSEPDETNIVGIRVVSREWIAEQTAVLTDGKTAVVWQDGRIL